MAMCTRATEVTDMSLGPSGGAQVPRIQSLSVSQVIPPEMLPLSLKSMKRSYGAGGLPVSKDTSAGRGEAPVAPTGQLPVTSDGAFMISRRTDELSFSRVNRIQRKYSLEEEKPFTEEIESTRKRLTLQSIWLDDENRCIKRESMISFFTEYANLPGSEWSNEVIRVERKTEVPWNELLALPFLECSVLFVVAEKDEMLNCNKDLQQAAFDRILKARSKELVEVPCELGGHAGMMDSCGLVGQRAIWGGMVENIGAFLVKNFGQHAEASALSTRYAEQSIILPHLQR